jgi:hypothetical protein
MWNEARKGEVTSYKTLAARRYDTDPLNIRRERTSRAG